MSLTMSPVMSSTEHIFISELSVNEQVNILVFQHAFVLVIIDTIKSLKFLRRSLQFQFLLVFQSVFSRFDVQMRSNVAMTCSSKTYSKIIWRFSWCYDNSLTHFAGIYQNMYFFLSDSKLYGLIDNHHNFTCITKDLFDDFIILTLQRSFFSLKTQYW